MTVQEITAWRGRTAVDANGDKIGTIEEIYLDADTGRPEWLAVKTGMFGTRVSFVPIAKANDDGGDVRVPFEKSHVKDAPHAEPDGQLSQTEEAALYSHYGLAYSESRSDSGLPEGGAGTTGGGGSEGSFGGAPPVGEDTSGETTDNAMTRSEEELRVGKTEQESGRVRLRKYVVEDEVSQTVPVKREEIRLEREPITDANAGAATAGPAISEEEHEVVLHEEEVVAEKRVVPKERVRLDKDVQVEERTVSEDVRREEIDVDAGGSAR